MKFIQFKAWKQSWQRRQHKYWDMSNTSQHELYCQCCLLAYTTNLGTTFSFDSRVCSFWVGKHFHWHGDIGFLEPSATKALGGQNYEKLYSIFPGRDVSETAQFLFMHCHIYYYSNNIQLSNLLDCRLGIREKSSLVKFSVRYESFYLKNCLRRNIQFSAVATQKWSHFIFCPQQDLMEEKNKLLLLSFSFYSFSFVNVSIELSENFPNIVAFHPLFWIFKFLFGLFYFAIVVTPAALKSTSICFLFKCHIQRKRNLLIAIIAQWFGVKRSGFTEFLPHPLLCF